MVNFFVLSTWKFTDFSEVNLVELFRAETKRFSTYTIQLEMPGFIRQKLNCCMNSAFYCLLPDWLKVESDRLNLRSWLSQCWQHRPAETSRITMNKNVWWQNDFVSNIAAPFCARSEAAGYLLAHAPHTREYCYSIWYTTTI